MLNILDLKFWYFYTNPHLWLNLKWTLSGFEKCLNPIHYRSFIFTPLLRGILNFRIITDKRKFTNIELFKLTYFLRPVMLTQGCCCTTEKIPYFQGYSGETNFNEASVLWPPDKEIIGVVSKTAALAPVSFSPTNIFFVGRPVCNFLPQHWAQSRINNFLISHCTEDQHWNYKTCSVTRSGRN